MTSLRRFLLVVAVFPATLILHDVLTPPSRQWSTRAVVGVIEQYRAHLSKHVGLIVQCRFEPTCSAYGLVSVKKYGALRGGARAIGRIARCGPWTKANTIDRP